MNRIIYLLDNFDSFTYNLVDMFRSAGLPVKIYRNSLNEEMIFQEMRRSAATASPVLVLSPGPGAPADAGCMMRLIGLCHGVFPIIGICLGHQALCEYYGGTVGPAGEIVHGKTSRMDHTGEDMFAGLPNPMPVARYHSLAATRVPECLEVAATCGTIPMAVIHREDHVVGFQFHPESVMTTSGGELLARTLDFVTAPETGELNFHGIMEKLDCSRDLNSREATFAFERILSGEVDPLVISSFLTALKIKGAKALEVQCAASALLKVAAPFPTPDYEFCDIVGTGGDNQATINISTTAAFTAAALGVKVCKHGNRAVSSKSGASDVLAKLGVQVEISAEDARKLMDETNYCFLFAKKYHSAMRHVAPVRQALATRTVFNILGPLINPAHPTAALIGVYDPALCRLMAETLQLLGMKRAFVVHGAGLDEVAAHGVTKVAELKDGEIREYEITPEDLGIQACFLKDLKGGDPEANAEITRRILRGEGTPAQTAAVAVNTAPLLVMAGKAQDLKEGTAMALECLASGKAYETLELVVRRSTEMSHE